MEEMPPIKKSTLERRSQRGIAKEVANKFTRSHSRMLALVSNKHEYPTEVSTEKMAGKNLHAWVKLNPLVKDDYINESLPPHLKCNLGGSLFDGWKRKYEDPSGDIDTAPPIMTTTLKAGATQLWAYQVACKVQNTENPELRYTRASSLQKLVSYFGKNDEGSSLSKAITAKIVAHFDIILLCDGDYFRNNESTDSFEDVVDYCTIHLVGGGMISYPPISLVRFIDNKSRRDHATVDFMLPKTSLYVDKKRNFQAIMGKEIRKLEKMIAEDDRFKSLSPVNKVVMKPENGSACIGVYFVAKEGRQWIAKDFQQAEVGKAPKAGTRYSLQPYAASLQKMEYRFFCTPRFSGGNQLKFQFMIHTSLLHNGTLNVGVPDITMDENNPHVKSCKQCIRQAFGHLKTTSGGRIWQDVGGITFRFDMFVLEEDAFINEIEVVPLAFTFLESYDIYYKIFDEIAKESASFIMNHTGPGKCWPN